MFASVALAIIGTVVAALVSVVSVLPEDGVTDASALRTEAPSATSDLASLDYAGNRLSSGIVSIVNEIASFRTDPDYQRAEARRIEMETIGEHLIEVFEELKTDMDAKLVKLTSPAE